MREDREQSATDHADEESRTGDERTGPLDVLSKFRRDVATAGSRLLAIHLERARLSTRRALVALCGAAGVVVFTAVALGSAASALTRGACAAFTEQFGGRAWLGDLAGGLAVLATFALVLGLAQRVCERRTLRALRIEYGDTRHETDHTNRTTSTPDAASAVRG